MTEKEIWRNTIKGDGGHCPVCDRWGKIYGRAINNTMARSLIWLCAAPTEDNGWVDVPNKAPRAVIRSNQLPTLHWWNLVERLGSENAKQKHSGMWRPTALGLDFVNGNAQVPRKVFTYNNKVQAYSLDMVRINECFKEQFDYQQLMGK